jgi:hypothetical protein
MSVRFPVFAALLALLSLLAACSLPPYNEDLSLAQITKSKMQRVNGIGPVHAWLDDDAPETEYYFLPDRNDPVNGGGFFVNAASYGLRIWYLADYSSTLNSSWAINLDNDDETANNYLLQPIKSAAGHYLSLIRYLPSGGYVSNDLLLIRATDPLNVSAILTAQLSNFLNAIPPPTVIAASSSIYPFNAAAYDLQYFLGYASPGGTYIEFECQTSESTGVQIPPPTISPDFTLSPLPADLRNVFYCHEKNSGLSYLSYWSDAGREYRSYSWVSSTVDVTGVKALPGIKGRIDAVLSSGELLSFQDGACTVYNGDGSKLYRFPLGGLRFCYERWDPDPIDPKFKLYFSLAYWLYGSDEVDDRLFVEVYAIPTADLKDLD